MTFTKIVCNMDKFQENPVKSLYTILNLVLWIFVLVGNVILRSALNPQISWGFFLVLSNWYLGLRIHGNVFGDMGNPGF